MWSREVIEYMTLSKLMRKYGNMRVSFVGILQVDFLQSLLQALNSEEFYSMEELENDNYPHSPDLQSELGKETRPGAV